MRLQSLGLVTVLSFGSAAAQSLLSDSIPALRAGGHVFVMRHAHSPSERPDAASAHRGNVRLERQLDTEGRVAARASSNVLLITHLPNLRGAFGDDAARVADGETLILRPDSGRVVVVGRVRIDVWSSLATD
jgi:hypothetical protein